MNKKTIVTVLIGLMLLPGLAYGINTVIEGFSVTSSNVTIDAHGVCRVAASTNGINYFVPTKTSTEWQSARDNKPLDLSLNTCSPPVNAVCGDLSTCSVDISSIYESCIDSRCAYMRSYWTCTGLNGGTNASCQSAPYFSCLTADTLITMADGTKKPIGKLAEGDKVVGKNGVNTIVVARHFTTYDYVYGINGSTPFVTGGHPFMAKKGWRAIDPDKTPSTVKTQINPGKLVVGDEILKEDGTYMKVTSITPSESPKGTVVYNPGVDGDNTYYANGMLVHNK